MPSGNVTDTSLTCAVASVAALELWGTCRSTVAPVGSSACVVAGATEIDGLNGTASQPVAGAEVAVATTGGPEYGVAVSFVVPCTPHSVGRLMNGVVLAPAAC